MALTQVNSNGLKDDSIINADVKSDAAIAGSKLAADSIAEEKLDISNSASDGQYLQYKDSTDKLTWASVSTTDSTKMPLAGGTFTGDVIFDNATNAGKDLTWDMSDNALEFTDDTKAAFGNGADLLIYHENTGQTYIQNATGNLRIDANALRLRSYTTGEDYLKADADGAVEIYYDNSKKVETTSYGIGVTGTCFATSDFQLDDGCAYKAGTGDDLQIYHNGSDSYIDEVGTGSVLIRSDTHVRINKQSAAESMATFNPDGSVELFYNNSKKLETTSLGAKVTGELQMGGTAGVKFSHSGTSSIYESQTAGDELLFKTTPSGGSSTTAITVSPIGDITLAGASYSVVWDKSDNALEFADNAKATFGAGDDLQIYHPSGHSLIKHTTTGYLRLLTAGSGVSITNDDQAEAIAYFLRDGACELYYDNSRKFGTTSAGGTLYGIWTGVGKILQVIESSTTNRASTSNTSFTDTNLSTQMTVAHANNNVQIMVFTDIQTASNETCILSVYASNDGGSNWDNLGASTNGLVTQNGNGNTSSVAASVKYHPNYAGAIDYKLVMKSSGGNSVYVPGNDGHNAARIIVMEINEY